jgi:hypothetical protein
MTSGINHCRDTVLLPQSGDYRRDGKVWGSSQRAWQQPERIFPQDENALQTNRLQNSSDLRHIFLKSEHGSDLNQLKLLLYFTVQ